MLAVQAPPVLSFDDIEARFRQGSVQLQHKFAKVAATMSALYSDYKFTNLSEGSQTFRSYRSHRESGDDSERLRDHVRLYKRATECTERLACSATSGLDVDEAFPETVSLTEQRFRRGSGKLQQHFLACKQPEVLTPLTTYLPILSWDSWP